MNRKRLLVVGSGGMLGSAVIRRAEAAGIFEAIGLDVGEIDITDEASVESAFKTHAPDAVINCAAFTNVEACEEEAGFEAAMAVNGKGPGILARACMESGASFIHLSTDYVFNGTSEDGVAEDEIPKEAMNAYGRTKRAGEHEVIKACGGLHGAEFVDVESDYYLVRISWLFGRGGKNFISKVLEIARRDGQISIVDDETSCPTYADDLADRLLDFLVRRPRSGIYHLTNNGSCSRYVFGAAALKAFGISADITPSKLANFPRKAHIASVSILKNTRTEKLPFWEDALRRFAAEQ